MVCQHGPFIAAFRCLREEVIISIILCDYTTSPSLLDVSLATVRQNSLQVHVSATLTTNRAGPSLREPGEGVPVTYSRVLDCTTRVLITIVEENSFSSLFGSHCQWHLTPMGAPQTRDPVVPTCLLAAFEPPTDPMRRSIDSPHDEGGLMYATHPCM